MPRSLLRVAEELIVSVKLGSLKTSNSFNSIKFTDLLKLNNDQEKLAFWINTYNSFTLILLKKYNPDLNNRIKRKQFFRLNEIQFYDFSISLDEIEHIILRRNKVSWSYGFIQNPFSSKKLKKLMVKKLDYRIHFALNCGAFSCPPIRFYSHQRINEELNIATKAFVSQNSEIRSNNKLYTSSLFKWYYNDFSGRKGIIRIHNLFLEETDKQIDKIHFMPYIWKVG